MIARRAKETGKGENEEKHLKKDFFSHLFLRICAESGKKIFFDYLMIDKMLRAIDGLARKQDEITAVYTIVWLY